jgi:hypothetical protein
MSEEEKPLRVLQKRIRSNVSWRLFVSRRSRGRLQGEGGFEFLVQFGPKRLRWLDEDNGPEELPAMVAAFEAPPAKVKDDEPEEDEEDPEQEEEAEPEQESEQEQEHVDREEDDEPEEKSNEAKRRRQTGGSSATGRSAATGPVRANVRRQPPQSGLFGGNARHRAGPPPRLVENGWVVADPPRPSPRPPITVRSGNDQFVNAEFEASRAGTKVLARDKPMTDEDTIRLIRGMRKTPGRDPQIEYLCELAPRAGFSQVPRWVSSAEVRKRHMSVLCDYFEKNSQLIPTRPVQKEKKVQGLLPLKSERDDEA